MRSPFPGMDPFLEGNAWRGFHADFIVEIKQAINAVLPDRYVARTETDVVLSEDAGWVRGRVGDVTVSDYGYGNTSAVAVAEPAAGTFVTEFPEPDERRYHWAEIVDNESLQVVTVIELLSPDNKRGRDNRHVEKRQEVLTSEANLVEIDLLRGGRRPMTVDPLPACDYAVFISEAWSRPKVTDYPWRLLDQMPTIPVPLREGEDAVPLRLQEIFQRTFNEGRYDRVVRYERPCDPPLPEAAQAVLGGGQVGGDAR